MTGSMGTPNYAPSYQPEKLRKIVCISDLHERWHLGTLQIDDFPSGDILLIAGDITFKGEHSKYIEFNNWLGQLDFGEIVMVPGNHDLTFETEWPKSESVMEHTYCLDQETVCINDLKIYGEPRQPEFFNWAFNVPRRKMKEVWDLVPPDTDVLLTHGPPLGAGDCVPRGEHVGCEFQLAWIKKHQPKLVVCGHIHSGYGTYLIGNTVVINASICNEQYRPVNSPLVIHL